MKKTGLSFSTINNPKSITSLRLLANILEQPIKILGGFEKLSENTLSQRITKARLFHGLTKEEFANQLGVDIRTLRSWEQDKHQPTKENISILERYLSILNN